MTLERRAALEAAFNEAQPDEKEETVQAAAVPETPAPEAAALPESVPEQKAEAEPYKKEAEAAQRPDQSKPVQQGTPEAAAPPVDAKAPTSWKPAEREHWAKIPLEAQAAIQRREKEVQQVLNTTANARKFQNEFVETVKPFAHLIRAQNSSPLAAVRNLMTTAAGLTTGNAEQKALIVAEVIANYGVDIATLDSVLSKQPLPANAGQAAIPQQFAQMLQPIHSFMDEVKTARQTQQERAEQEAAQSVEQFGASKPYFNDVREDMADLLDVAAKRGRVLTLDQAYTQAVSMNPELSKIVEQQKKATSVSEAAATLAKARNAASTVRGAPQGVGVPKPPGDRREALERAWSNSTSN